MNEYKSSNSFQQQESHKKKGGLNRKKATFTIVSTPGEHYPIAWSVWVFKLSMIVGMAWNLETALIQLVPPHNNNFIQACWIIAIIVSCVPYWLLKHFGLRLSAFYSLWERIRSNEKIMGAYAHAGGGDKEQEETNEIVNVWFDQIALAAAIYIFVMNIIAIIRAFPDGYFFSNGGWMIVLTRILVLIVLDLFAIAWSIGGESIAYSFKNHGRIEEIQHTILDKHYKDALVDTTAPTQTRSPGLSALPSNNNNKKGDTIK